MAPGDQARPLAVPLWKLDCFPYAVSELILEPRRNLHASLLSLQRRWSSPFIRPEGRNTCPLADHFTPSLVLVSGAAQWMGPDLSARRPPECPVLSATISAAIAMAVSSGVRAPMSRPMGLLTRASCSSVTPSSLRRAVLLSCVLRLPIAPM